MERTINKFVWKHSARQQIILVLMTLAYFPSLYVMLELPKLIINRVIGDTANYSFFNLTLDAEAVLILLALIYLFLYLINALLKLIINIRKGGIGERLIRRLRYNLLEHLLRFPLQRFRGVSQGELISLINAETEPLAGYVSESVTLPLFQGGTMITVLAFMFVQSFWLGLAAVALIPLQVVIIPRMQRKVNVLNHERVRQVRTFSEYIGETVSGAQAIRIHGVQRYVLSGVSMHLGRLFDVRLKLYKQKYLIKFVNNFINQLTPFLFYMIGGLLVLRGNLTVGALVAAIAGHKEMVAPWKELLKYYQMRQDAEIKYDQLVLQFEIPNLDESDYNHIVPGRAAIPLFPLSLNNVVTEEDGAKILNRLNLKINSGEHVAYIEPDSVKRQHIAEVILSLRQPDYGSAWLGSSQINDLPGAVKSRRIAFQPSLPPIFNISVYENILFSIKHIPIHTVSGKDATEAILAGSSDDNFSSEWTDYDEFQFKDDVELHDWYIRALEAADANRSMIEKGLFQFLPNAHASEQANKIVQIRAVVQHALQDSDLGIAIFDEREWCNGLSIAENLAFGKLSDNELTPGEVLYSEEIAEVLGNNGFTRIIEQIGRQIATMVVQGLSSELSREHTMQTFKLNTDEQAEAIVRSIQPILRKSSNQLVEQDKEILSLLFLNLVLEDHADVELPGSVISRVMFIRDEIDNTLDHEQRVRLQRFEYGQFHPGLTVLENLMFGMLPRNTPQESLSTLLDIIERVIGEAELSRDIMLLTLKNADAGISGSRLSATSRQTLPLARVLVKKPELIVFNDGLNTYEEAEQFIIKENIRRLLPETSILWLTSKLEEHSEFDRVIDSKKSA